MGLGVWGRVLGGGVGRGLKGKEHRLKWEKVVNFGKVNLHKEAA